MQGQQDKLPNLTRSWDKKWPWPFTFISDEIEVTAWQTLIPDQDPGLPTPFATAKVLIRKNGKVVLSDSINWGMFAFEPGLLLQVYCLSQQPDYKSPEWQPALKKFCESFDTFEKPTEIYWSKAGEDPLFD